MLMQLSRDYRRYRPEIDALIEEHLATNRKFDAIGKDFGYNVKAISKKARNLNLGRGRQAGRSNNNNKRWAISQHIKDLIADGKLNSNDRLPYQYEMMIKFHVSESTVHNAYCDLEKEGVVCAGPTKRGKVVK